MFARRYILFLFLLNHCSANQVFKPLGATPRIEKIDVWVPSFKNVPWTMFNIKNMLDLARNPSGLAIRVICMTPGENSCEKIKELLDSAFPTRHIAVHDLSQTCTGVGGSALPCVFSHVLNNTPKESTYTVLADTDAIVVKHHWDSFIRQTLGEYCLAGINPRTSLGAVEWNWLSFQSSALRDSRNYTDTSIVKEMVNIKDFKDWGQWWEMKAQMHGCSTVKRFPYLSQLFKGKSPMLVSDGLDPPNAFVAHMFYLSRRRGENLKQLGEDTAVITEEQEKLVFSLLKKGFFNPAVVAKLPLDIER
mmetsp:Transcript_28745/g.53491  ORF Transcript_28745/g.53491 Transcript_28745/m.53491 type:complete len:305 (-) Transcript_28745:195-1109(-)